VYYHHGGWWHYYREYGNVVRCRVADDRQVARQLAAQVNSRLILGTPIPSDFGAIKTTQLRQDFLDYHENVLGSSHATVCRYRSATQHLENYSRQLGNPPIHALPIPGFVTYLRRLEISPNGHPHSERRQLRRKGLQYILETCRSLFAFALKRRHFPPYAANPFSEIPIGRLQGDDAKAVFVFDAESELAFFQAADRWSFALFFVLAKTGLRVGELLHLLIEDLDLELGWLWVRNKPELGWRIKTGRERMVPLIPEVVALLRRLIEQRRNGPVFLRRRYHLKPSQLKESDRSALIEALAERRKRETPPILKAKALQLSRSVWRDAGAIKADSVRQAFMRTTRRIGYPDATCPKSWRHTFATLLQEANVDPLVRQLVLGHVPTASNGLGMTARYTHTRSETIQRQITAAMALWPKSLALAQAY
jgi:integrase